MMQEILTALDMTALNEVRANPSISITKLQSALGLKHKGQATRLLTRLQSFGLIERPHSVCGAKRRLRRRPQFHLHQKAAA